MNADPIVDPVEEGYVVTAADQSAEAEALEWIEALVGDVADEPDE